MIKTRSPKKGRTPKQGPARGVASIAPIPRVSSKHPRTGLITSEKAEAALIASMAELSPSFDLLGELDANGADYICGDKWIAMTKFPNYVRTSLDRVRMRTVPPRPEVSAALCACIRYGIRTFYASSDIQAIQAMKERAFISDDVGADEVVELARWFADCPLTIPDWGDSGLKRQNVAIPEPIKKELDHLASEIGCTASDLSTFAVMVALADQPGVLEAHRDAMITAVQGFLMRMNRRRRKAEVLIAMALEDVS